METTPLEPDMLRSVAPFRRVRILDIPVDCINHAETMAILQGFLEGQSPNLIATADASGIMIAQSDPDFRNILESASLITPDSIGVIWAGKRLGHPFEGRVSGVELVDALCALSAEHGHRIFLLGAAPGVADMAAERLKLRHPGCNIVGTRHGFFPAADDAVVAEEVAKSRPDILFVAMGIPRQEKFIFQTMGLINAKIAMGVGGSLDVFSGKVKRAPKFVQKLHLEWLWRTLANPKKIAKAKHLPVFAWTILRQKRAK